jgi:hypothetical protein
MGQHLISGFDMRKGARSHRDLERLVPRCGRIARGVATVTRLILVATAALLAVPGLAPAASGARSESEILFRDERAMSIQSGQLKQTRTVVLCNSSASVATRLTWSLVGFEFTKAGAPVSADAVIALEGARSRLNAGSCSAARITVTANPGIDAGAVPGQLVVTSAGKGTARVNISVAGPASTVVPTQGAAATIELTATQWVPFLDIVSVDGDGALALKAPPKGKSLEVAAPGAFIGNLVNGPHVASVFVKGKPDKKDSEGVWLLPIEVRRANHPGDYEGTLTPTASAAEDQTVKTKITVTDFWLWAVLAVVLGAAIVVLPTLYIRRWRLESELHERHRALPSGYSAAGQEFHRRFPVLREIQPPTEADVARYTQEADTAIRAYAESTWYFDTTSDAYEKIVESLDAADEDVKCLAEADGLGETLDELNGRLTRLAGDLAAHLPIDRQPAVALTTSALLRPGQLAVGEARIRKQKAKRAIATIGEWTELAQSLARYEAWYGALEKLSPPSQRKFPPDDLAALSKIWAEIGEAKNELLEAADAAAIAKLGIPERLTAIYGQLAVLGASWSVWVVSEPDDSGGTWPKLTLVDNGVSSDISTEIRETVAEIQGKLPAVARDPQSWRQNADALVVISAAKTVELGKIKRFVGDAMVVALSVATGVVTSLSAFYFGKTFGTWEDYVTVIFVGTAAQAFLKPITDTLAQLRGGTEPVTKSDPKEAVVTSVAQVAS